MPQSVEPRAGESPSRASSGPLPTADPGGAPESDTGLSPPDALPGSGLTARIPWVRRVLALWPPVACFIASRAVVAGALYAAPVLKPGFARSSFFSDWDAAHYLDIARSGYPPFNQPHGGYDAHVAFFPLLPMLVRGLHATGLPLTGSGVLVANLATLAAFCLIWILVRDLLDGPRATATVALIAFWPASFTLSMVYPDSLLLLLSAAYLLALLRERWWMAAAVGVLAGLSRPDAVVLTLCGLWVAVATLRSRPSWRPWLAAAGPAAGFVAYLAYLWAAQGSPTLWFHAEQRGWHASFDFGAQWWSDALIALHHPTGRIDLAASTIAGVIGIGLLVWMVAIRLPPVLTLYAGGVLLLAIGSGFGGSVPRLALDAFPLFIPPAAKLPPAVITLLVGILAGAMAVFVLVVELTRTTTP